MADNLTHSRTKNMARTDKMQLNGCQLLFLEYYATLNIPLYPEFPMHMF